MKTCFPVVESQGSKFFFVGSCIFAFDKPGGDYTEFYFPFGVESIAAKPDGLEVFLRSGEKRLIFGGLIPEAMTVIHI